MRGDGPSAEIPITRSLPSSLPDLLRERFPILQTILQTCAMRIGYARVSTGEQKMDL
jgi:hypothetical protein